MVNTFSIRNKVVAVEKLGPQDMPSALRNRLWNSIQEYIDASPRREKLIGDAWDRFFKENLGGLYRNNRGGYQTGQLRSKFYTLSWNLVYDFLEFLLDGNSGTQIDNFTLKLNLVFFDEGVPYKIISGKVISLTSEEEAQEVYYAATNKYSEVSQHIKNALELYRKRPDADYKNSIKESISAVEALAKITLNEPKATLGDLADQLNVHPAFHKAMKALYGWTSDASGVRHAEHGQGLTVGENEARYMLVQCSALVNYIISKEKP